MPWRKRSGEGKREWEGRGSEWKEWSEGGEERKVRMVWKKGREGLEIQRGSREWEKGRERRR